MRRIAFMLCAGLAAAQPVYADDAHHEPAAGAEQAGAPLSKGEVRKVDKDAGKITLKHGPLENLGMPAMTMVVRVKDPAMLEQVKPGDRVKFEAEEVGGALTVVRIEPVR